MEPSTCCVLNGGEGAWAFDGLAAQLADALWVDVAAAPRRFNYLLSWEGREPLPDRALFIQLRSVELAADKRLLAAAFAEGGVPTPETLLLDSWQAVLSLLGRTPGREWCLKYPLGCGAAGHRLLAADLPAPRDWPLPYVVQEFIRLDRPEVYRTYAAGGTLFGWVARRFPAGARPSPWVAHARGARYEAAGVIPPEAAEAAGAALAATGLLGSFGCADLLRRPSGQWVVLEVGTDGLHNHVDRELGDPEVERELRRRVAESFWARAGSPPWGTRAWLPMTESGQDRRGNNRPERPT